jgi:RNA polymerase sigma-70 factor (ECF subfamily)
MREKEVQIATPDKINYERATNEELLGLYKSADTRAFQVFYKRSSKLLFNFLLSRMRNQQAAEDALQETYFRIHKYVSKFDPNQKALGWTFQIARNVLIDAYKKKPLNETPFNEDAFQSIDPRVALDARDTLNDLLKKLNEDDATLIRERFLNDETFETLAKKHGLTGANARQKISRLLKKIRLDSNTSD